VSLFDGKTLNGWHLRDTDGPNCWSAQDGELVCTPQPQCVGKNLVTDQLFRDFELQLEFLMEDASNSGVYLRGLYEVQLYDDNAKLLGPKGRCGAIFGQVAPSEEAYLGPGKWNTLNVKLIGPRVSVTMNGKRIIDDAYVMVPTDREQILDVNMGDPGPIMLQCMSGGRVRFRNISIKRIDEQSHGQPEPATEKVDGREDMRGTIEYTDPKSPHSKQPPRPLDTASSPMAFGSNLPDDPQHASFFTGALDEVVVYDRVLVMGDTIPIIGRRA
jgi:hypothetical protein